MQNFSLIQKKILLAQASPTQNTTTYQGDATPQTAKQPPSSASNPIQLLFPVLLIVILYLVLLRPQQKREKRRKEMIKLLKKGDKIITRGGIWGTVVSLKPNNNTATIQIADQVKIQIDQNAIESVEDKTATKKDKE